jgi:hypothetical protein
MLTSMAITAITTRSSINVKARRFPGRRAGAWYDMIHLISATE